MTSTLANLIHPIAAVTLMFPISSSLQYNDETSGASWAIESVLMVAASTGFLSKYSNHCNHLVNEIGDYTQKEFFKLGLPLLIGCMCFSVFFAPTFATLHPHCIQQRHQEC